MNDPPRAAAIRTLYRQAPNSAAAALVVTAYMTVTAWPFGSRTTILEWLAAQAIAQVGRLALIRAFTAADPADDALPRWAGYYTAYMALAGLLWGASAVLFIHPDQPITLALTLCGLYGISSGSVPGNAYNPAGLNAFVIGIFGCVLIDLLLQGGGGNAALGIASACFAGILILFCRVQNHSILETFAIRFQNEALLEALRRRTAEAEEARGIAEAANLAKSQFLAAASHDLRQPLHALGLLTGALATTRRPAEAGEVLDNIQANVAALEGLFNGLLDIARFDAEAVQPVRQPIACDELFDRIEHYLRPMATEFGIDLRLRSDGALLHSDPVLLEQILLNLGANALRHSGRGGVLIGARRRGRHIRLEVWDQGPGIAEGDRARIFDEFVQIGNPERDRRRGMGLGLAIARRAAHLLGTDVTLRSAPGRGSVFRIDQPAFDAPVADAMAPAAPAPRRPRVRSILVLDDDPAVRAAFQKLIGGWGVEIACVATASECVAALEARRCALMLIDYRLSGPVNGLDLLTRLTGTHRDRWSEAYILTGDLSAALIAEADKAGIPLLQKPLSPARLRGLLGIDAAGEDVRTPA